VIQIASDSSLTAFRYKNMYQASYWQYRSYLAGRRFIVSFNATPFNYNRALTKRYDYTQNIDVYREQQLLNSEASLSVNQNVTPTGGNFYVSSNLGRLQNLGTKTPLDYSITPVSIGFAQPLFGFNRFKWERKIEPLKFELAKRELISSIEELSMSAVDYFFNLAAAQMQLNLATRNLANSDTLYQYGQQRFAIAAITQTDLFSLRLDFINAQNALDNARKDAKQTNSAMASFLTVRAEQDIVLNIPFTVPELTIDADDALKKSYENNPDILSYKQQNLEVSRDLEQAKVNSRFSANLSASYGLNKNDTSLGSATSNLLNQQTVLVSVSIPILDWGQRRGQYNLARKQAEVRLATVKQNEIDFVQDIKNTVSNFNIQQKILKSASEADTLARLTYDMTKQRFLIGKSDINSLNLARSRQDQAQINYINELKKYWGYYYKIRKLTLYDYEKNNTLSADFDKLLQ
jgi:outer membrane protein TolC